MTSEIPDWDLPPEAYAYETAEEIGVDLDTDAYITLLETFIVKNTSSDTFVDYVKTTLYAESEIRM